jgi:hypothetical protein
LGDLQLGTNQEVLHLIFLSNDKLVFIQMNLRVLESVETNDAIQGSNLDDIYNTKVPDLGQLPK